jgi:hypothetical protein
MSSPEARARLAEAQARLMQALSGGAAPADFDAERIRATAQALANKRARAAARAWPALAGALGDDFDRRFAEYAAEHSLPAEGGPLADGRGFAAHLAARGELPDEGRLEAFGVDLRYRRSADGLRPRRGAVFKAAWLRGRRRLVLGVRLPWLGVRWLSLPLGWLFLTRTARGLRAGG